MEEGWGGGGGSQTYGGDDRDENGIAGAGYRPLRTHITQKQAPDVSREDLLKDLENVRRVTARLLEDFDGAYSDKRVAYANAYFRGVQTEAILMELLESRSAPTKRPIAGRKPF